MDRLNPASSDFQKVASTTAQSRVSQVRSQKDLKPQESGPSTEDAVELTGLMAEQVARAAKETGLDKRKKVRTAAESTEAEAGDEQPEEEGVDLQLSDPTEGVPEASLQAAGRIVNEQVQKKPPLDLKNVPGTLELQMKPAPMEPIEEISENHQGPLSSSE